MRNEPKQPRAGRTEEHRAVARTSRRLALITRHLRLDLLLLAWARRAGAGGRIAGDLDSTGTMAQDKRNWGALLQILIDALRAGCLPHHAGCGAHSANRSRSHSRDPAFARTALHPSSPSYPRYQQAEHAFCSRSFSINSFAFKNFFFDHSFLSIAGCE